MVILNIQYYTVPCDWLIDKKWVTVKRQVRDLIKGSCFIQGINALSIFFVPFLSSMKINVKQLEKLDD